MAYILIVDSQVEFRQQLVRLLEQAGHRATAVVSVSEATSLLQTEVPDLLATDVVLTEGSSTSLVQQAEAAGAKTLMMTGNPDRCRTTLLVKAVSTRSVHATGSGVGCGRVSASYDDHCP
jgi:DNA-binding NtrC family response regulator